MIKTSKQLKDLVGNRAHGDSAKSMLFLRNYAMERFLERLSASKYRNCFILKGGMLISAMVGIDSRATMDIDTTLRNYPLNCESAEQIVRQIADVEIDDKISFVIKKTEEIMEDSEYQGVRLSLDAYLDKTRIPLKIDISTGDVITPCEISFSYQLMFENEQSPCWHTRPRQFSQKSWKRSFHAGKQIHGCVISMMCISCKERISS